MQPANRPPRAATRPACSRNSRACWNAPGRAPAQEDDENRLAREARAILAQASELADLVRLGAYKSGADPSADRALRLAPAIETLLHQGRTGGGRASAMEHCPISAAFAHLRAILETTHAP